MKHSAITTHILDTSTGLPAKNVGVKLFKLINDSWSLLSEAATDSDGRIKDWAENELTIDFATYKLIFDLDSYFVNQSTPAFYPYAEICFRVQDEKHHHIPLLLSSFGYSTYRGS